MIEAGFLETVIGWIGPLFSGVAGYVVIGTAVLLERSILIGLVIPGDVILAIGGIQAARGDASLAIVIALGIGAAIVGESAGYWLGNRFGRSIIGKIPLVRRLEDKIDEVQELFDRHGGATVVIGRYATAAGAFVPFVAGMGKMRYLRFVAFDVPSVIVWGFGITLVGYFLGENLDAVDSVLSRFGWGMLGLLVVLGAGYLWYRRRRAG